MKDALIFNEGAGPVVRNFANPFHTTGTGSPAWKVTRQGIGGYCTGGASFDIPDYTNLAAGSVSFRVRFVADTWPNAFTAIFDKGNSGTGFRELSLFADTSGVISYLAIGRTQSVQSLGSFPAGQVNEIVVTRDIGGASATVVYGNGVSLGAPSGVYDATGDTENVLAIGRNPSSGGAAFNGTYLVFNTWTRVLSPAEVLECYTTPYAFLRPLLRRRYFIFTESVVEPEVGQVQEHIGRAIGRGFFVGR